MAHFILSTLVSSCTWENRIVRRGSEVANPIILSGFVFHKNGKGM